MSAPRLRRDWTCSISPSDEARIRSVISGNLPFETYRFTFWYFWYCDHAMVKMAAMAMSEISVLRLGKVIEDDSRIQVSKFCWRVYWMC